MMCVLEIRAPSRPWRVTRTATAVIASSSLIFSAAYAQELNCSPTGQWYTGSLLSASGALPKAGMIAIEPYLIGSYPVAKFDSNGHSKSAASTEPRSVANANVLGAALTDHLTIQAVPNVVYSFDSAATSDGVRVGDLPLQLLYRLIDPQPDCVPALTGIIGVTLPLGTYDHLSRVEDASGGGAWALRLGLQSQLALRLSDDRALRIRVWGQASQAVSTVNVQGASVYGTSNGFDGHADPGITGSVGVSFEYGLTQRWVLALDAAYNVTKGARVRGKDSIRGPVEYSTERSSGWTFAPAIEYNWSSHLGLIVGVAVTPIGHNMMFSIQPHLALNMVF
jgi:hypothetical protein